MYDGWILFLSALVAFIVVTEAIIHIKKWMKHKRQSNEYDSFLKDPFAKLVFLIPRADNFKVAYYDQLKDKHRTIKKLELPANSTMTIFLMFKPKENFTTNDMYFGFEGNKGEKPSFIKYNNPFVVSTNCPEIKYLIDWHEDFHLKNEKHFYKYEYYVYGFDIETKKTGVYDLYIKFPIICDRYRDIKERRQEKVIVKKLNVIVVPKK